MLHDHKGIKRFEKEAVDHSEITRPDFVGMILQEGTPVLSARLLPDLFHILLDCPFVNYNFELEELAMNLFGAPFGISYGICLMSAIVSRGMRGFQLLGVDFFFQ